MVPVAEHERVRMVAVIGVADVGVARVPSAIVGSTAAPPKSWLRRPTTSLQHEKQVYA
jgi:hypothetical protein